MKQKQVEILAPAGSFESMTAAISAGADAVYIGGSLFGARAYADNLDEQRMLEAIDYAHLHGCRLYMTVNTLVKEGEMDQLHDYLAPFYRHGLDAVIVQDLGVFSYIRKNFPNLPIHASTQMTITGAYGAKTLAALGADRIVTARELSLEEIARIHKEVDIEIESFVHGALCYCYSGQCLFSSLVGGRSGNRGRCAQPCRLPYEVKDDGKNLNKKDDRYALSLKDLCTLDLIPHMIEAGIYSLKIEGRMKSPRYTAGVVSIYRKYVDLYLNQGRNGYRVEEKDKTSLLELFDRGGFTEGYYRQHNGKDMVAWKEKPSFREGNQELFRYLDETYVQHHNQEPVKGRVCLEAGKPMLLELTLGEKTVTVLGDIPQEAQNQPLTEEKLRKQINKTGNSPFVFSKLEVSILGNLFMPLQSLNELRRRAMEELEQSVTEQYRRTKAPNETVEAPLDTIVPVKEQITEIPSLSVSLERPDALHAVIGSPDVSRVYLEAAEFAPGDWKAAVNACHKVGKLCMLAMPHIFRAEADQFFLKFHQEMWAAKFDGVLIRSMEEIEFLNVSELMIPMIFDYNMYTMNHLSKEVMDSLGAAGITFPVELNSRELEALNSTGELIVYGHLPMMVTAQCIAQGVEGCRKTPKLLMIKDRMGKEFPVKNHCTFCYNTIYNSDPLSLLGQEALAKRIGARSIRLQFTIEDPKETKEIIAAFADGFLHNIPTKLERKDFTRGHFKRGVE